MKYYNGTHSRKGKDMKVSYLALNGSLVLNVDGKTHNIHCEDDRYKDLYEALKNEDWDTIVDLLSNPLEKLADSSEFEVEYSEYTGDITSIKLDGEDLPPVLRDRAMAYVREGLSTDSLVKFTRKLRKNPSLNSRKMLYRFLEHNGHPITPDGNFIAYRGVTDDFKDCRTRTFDNSPGSVCEMDRSEVDDNPNNTCSNGLHVASWRYASTFGTVKVEVEVDPRDVVCVPVDYNGTKMRVCKFTVLNQCEVSRDGEVVYGEAPKPKKEREEFIQQEWDDLRISWHQDVQELIIEFLSIDNMQSVYTDVSWRDAHELSQCEDKDDALDFINEEIVPCYSKLGDE